MSSYNDEPNDRLGWLDESSEKEPGAAKPPLPNSAEERFLKQVQELLNFVDPSHVSDSWEKCSEDAASSSSADVRAVPPVSQPAP
jgi:hypothetical protein